MPTDNDNTKFWAHLFGGAQDGFRRKIELKTTAPRRFFIWHVNDGPTIDGAQGPDRMVLQSRQATMAYELYDRVDLDGETELRYRRCEAADKAQPASA